MHKQEFLARLRSELACLPEEDREERLNFYSEMIDDRMEDGLSEEEAVRAIGSAEDIASQIIAETPMVKLVREKLAPAKKHRAWEIVLLVLGSPLWLSLLLAVFGVIVSVWFCLWAAVFCVWAAFAALAAGGIGGAVGGIVCAVRGYIATGIAAFGAGLVCAGLSVFLFFAGIAVTKGAARLTKYAVVRTKRSFAKKEGA